MRTCLGLTGPTNQPRRRRTLAPTMPRPGPPCVPCRADARTGDAPATRPRRACQGPDWSVQHVEPFDMHVEPFARNPCAKAIGTPPTLDTPTGRPLGSPAYRYSS